ncbi:MAG TPA: ABC transporter permease [Pyrinomonadaceae bacterium]|jgi:putative ABC transport system permease protein
MLPPRWLSLLWRNWFHKAGLEQELDEELRAYTELLTEEKVKAGISAAAARRAALLEVGGMEQVKEQVREVRVGAMLETILKDIRYSIRLLAKHPGFAVVAVLTIALGVGANTAIFSVVNAVLLRPLPFKDPERLVRLSEQSQQGPGMSIAYPNFKDWRSENTVFAGLAASRFDNFNLTGLDEPERLQGRNVSWNFFDVLGVQPALGRSFRPEEDSAGGERVCVISYGLWQRRFGADPQLVGRQVTLNSESYTVIGVLPQGYRYGTPTDVFTPIGLRETDELFSLRDNHPGIYAIARLKPEISLTQAEAEMKGIAARLAQAYPKENAGHSVSLMSMREYFVGDIRPSLLILLGAVGFVLLIACANVANLMLARAAARTREIAIRMALGAGRWRVVRQLLTESVLLAILGGACGLLLALWGVDVLRRASLDIIPTTADVSLDRTVLGFTLLVTLLTGVLFGLAPAFQSARQEPGEALKDGGRTGTTGVARNRVRALLVVGEVALSLMLLVGSGLLIRSFVRLREVDTGFDPHNLLTMHLTYRADDDEDGQKGVNFYDEVLAKIKTLPGVEAGAVANGAPFLDEYDTSFEIEGRPPASPDQRTYAVSYSTSPDYLRALGLRLVRGRFFDARDTQQTPPVAVIDEEFARLYFPGADPIGQYLAANPAEGTSHVEIVGVVTHVKQFGLDVKEPIPAQLYRPRTQIPAQFRARTNASASLLVRTTSDPAALAPIVRRAVHEIDNTQPVYAVNTMAQILSDSLAAQRLSMLLLSLFAAGALIIAAVGIYGVMSYSVVQRTHELGIRLALGAQPRDVLRLVIRQGMLLALAGVAVGLIGALLLTRVMTTLLYGVHPTDPVTFTAVSLILLTVALTACFIPARRATRVDPLIALRDE